MSGSKPVKLPRATLEQKIKILDFYHRSDKPQLDTVEAFKDEVAISTLTFNEWVKKEDEYRQQYQALEGEFQKNSRRKTKFKYEKINRAMDLVVKQRLERGEPVTEPILRDYWQVYAHQFGVDNPKRLSLFSHGWLSQFKKRHGINKLKRASATKFKGAGADLTTSSNKKLLTEPSPETEPSMPSEQIDVQTKYVSEPVGLFKPQQSLNFVLPYPRHSEDPEEILGAESNRLSTGLYDNSTLKDTSLSSVSAGDFEQLLQSVAEPFFFKNQYDYPQSMKLFQELKSAFVSERLICVRSAQEDFRKVRSLQGNQSNNILPTQSMGSNGLLELSKPSQKGLSSQKNVGSESSRLGLAYDSVPRNVNQRRAPEVELKRDSSGDFALRNAEHSESNDMARSLVAADRPGRLHLTEQAPKDYEKHSLRDSQRMFHQRELSNQNLLHSQAYRKHRQARQHVRARSDYRVVHNPKGAMLSRPVIQELPRLALTDSMESPLLLRSVSSHGLSASLSIAAPFSNSRDERNRLDEIFNSPAPLKSSSYEETSQWGHKSDLRKMWEQNKILLS